MLQPKSFDTLNKRLFYILLVLFVLFFSYALIQKVYSVVTSERQNLYSLNHKYDYLKFNKTDMVFNPGNKVHIVVYGNTECPFCAKQDLRLENLLKKNPRAFSISYRYLFSNIYKRVPEESFLLECVREISNDTKKSFAFQTDLHKINSSEEYQPDKLIQMATVYVNEIQLRACINDESVKQRVRNISDIGHLHGAVSTPYTYIYSDTSEVYKLVGSQSTSTLEKLIKFANTNNL